MTVSHSAVKFVLLVGLTLVAVGTYKRGLLPSAGQIVPEALTDPIQIDKANKPFTSTVKKVEYSIAPVADYELRGVVVSRHDSASFWDVLHSEWNDHLNVADLCIVWGNNLNSDVYRELAYHNGQFTCNYSASSGEVFTRFNENEISNNHILTDDPAIAKQIRRLNIGDQVMLRGVLAKYSHNSGGQFVRGTSTVRTDRGNGACETVYVSDVQVLKHAASWPSWLRWSGGLLTLLACFLWVFATKLYEDS
jgi:hypothetical protein